MNCYTMNLQIRRFIGIVLEFFTFINIKKILAVSSWIAVKNEINSYLHNIIIIFFRLMIEIIGRFESVMGSSDK